MIIYAILLILQYQVSTAVTDLVVVFALFVFMLALLSLLCFLHSFISPQNVAAKKNTKTELN